VRQDHEGDVVSERLTVGHLRRVHRPTRHHVECLHARASVGDRTRPGVWLAFPPMTVSRGCGGAGRPGAARGLALLLVAAACNWPFRARFAALSPLLLLAGFFGFKMGGDARQSVQQRESVATFWRIVVGSLVAFVMLPFLLLVVLNILPVNFSGDFRQRVMDGMTIWLGLMYAVVPAALILWAWQRRRKFQSQPAYEPEVAVNPGKKKRFVLWVIIAMIGTASLLGLVLSDSNNKSQHMTVAEVQKMIMDGKGKEAQFSISQYQNGSSNFWIRLRANGKRAYFSAPVDDATLALIKEQGIKCPTYVQGRDFEVFGWPGRFLPVFCIFILAIGGVVLLRKPGKFNPQEMDAQRTREMQQVERTANKVFGTVVALVLIAISLLLVRFTLHHIYGQTISVTEARRIIAENKNARAGVIQYNNGSKEMEISIPGHRSYTADITSVYESTLTLLAENKIPYNTAIQGRDFGYRQPDRWLLLSCSFILIAGAILVLWWAWKKERRFPAPAESRV